MVQAEDQKSSVAVGFIDPLFAIVISISFVEVMKQPWFNPNSDDVQLRYVFDILTLVLGYMTIILSWVGYHRAIITRPHKLDTFTGQMRFFVDIALLACYWLMLVKFEFLRIPLTMLAGTYLLYVVWDQLDGIEYPDRGAIARVRHGVSTFWFIFFASLAISHWLFGIDESSIGVIDWIFLSLAMLGVIVYRLHKWKPMPSKVLYHLTIK